MSQHASAVSGSYPSAEPGRPAAVMSPHEEVAHPERDRRRYAWMYEDEDIWGTDGVGCVPPSTYGDDWHAPRM